MRKFLIKICIIFIFICSLFITNVYGFDKKIEAIDDSKDSKIIYLTFDDGPSCNTGSILNTLKTYDVKATFFLIGNQIQGQEAIVKRIVNEGHSVGLHSYTHKTKSIYSNNERFIDEMLKCQDEIYRVTGVKTNIIRFPCGSAKRLNSGFKEKLEYQGFKIYDWNIDSGDGIKPKTAPDRLFKRSIENKMGKNPVILLMHCDYCQKNTCKALPKVIKFYKDKGYEFKVIDKSTPEYYFPFKK
ncbi:polysaccharide deacetylase family protein [Clostridium rectalis]|uniref:polysaccharide deacetylase family protein n=1 Tax=Clostridium rectalis TaxID=2040295 RepID=UPI000F641620|nr:polysaccharide deacetylase family protein [Clostridium rectalis]